MAGVGDGTQPVSLTQSRDPDGTLVVAIAGELDMSNVEDVRAALEDIGAGAPGLAFDLSALAFMDSSGIALLLQIADRSGSLRVRNVPPLIRRIFETMGMDEVLVLES